MDNKLKLVVNFLGVDKLSGSIRNIIGTGKTGVQVLKGMKDEARSLERQLAGVRKEIANGAGNLTSLINKEKQLESAVAGANTQMERQKRLLSVNARIAAITARADQLKTSGADNVIGGASMIAPFLLAAREAGNFQDGMIDIALKADLTRRETALMTRQILSASIAAKQLPESMRQGLDILAGFGLDPRIGMKMLGPIGQAATAYKAEISDLAAVSYSNFQNLKVPIKDNARALEIMAAAGKAGAFELKDMALYFPALTGYAQALGQSGVSAVSDLSAALQVARITAKDSASAATNVENLLAKIQSKSTIEKFSKNFGVDLPAAMKRAYQEGKTPLEAIAEIANKTVNGDLSKLSFIFEDMQAQNALRPLIQNIELYRKIRAESFASRGAIATDFARRSEGANTNGRLLIANLQKMAITTGAVLLPSLVKLSGHLVTITAAVANWAEAHPKAASFIIQAVVAMGAMRIGLGVLQFAFGSILGPVGKLWGLMSKWHVLKIASNMLKLLGSGAMIAGRAILFVGRAMMLNPIGLLVTAMAVSAYMIYKHWDTIKAAFWSALAAIAGAWNAIQSAYASGVAFLVGIGWQMIGIGRNIIIGLANGIIAAGGAIWNAIRDAVMGGINKLKSLLGIKSPSRLFMGLGAYMSKGMEIGISKGGRGAIAAAGRLATGVAAAGAITLSPVSARSGIGFANGAGQGAGLSGRSANGSGTLAGSGAITLNIYAAPGQDVKALADEVMVQLQRAQGVNQRSSYSDGE